MMITTTCRRLTVAAALVIAIGSPVRLAAEPTVETNVVFATYSGLALLMDVHKPDKPNGFGIILVNGSGWYRDLGYDATLLKQSPEFRPATQKLVAAGYTVFVVTHRASPRFHIPDAVQDVQRATRFVRANAARYGIRADRIGALGGSSGGHLVSMLGAHDGRGDASAPDPIERESAKVQCVVAFYPAIDLAKINTPEGLTAISLGMAIRPPGPNATGASFAVKQFRDASPVTHVTSDDPPFLLVHGDADTVVPYQQSEIMEAALQKAGVPVKLVRVTGGLHGTGSAGWDKIDWSALVLDWFESHLRQPSSSAP